MQAGNVVAFEHYAAATHATAMIALQSIDAELDQHHATSNAPAPSSG